jgi:hypothetical protein
MSYQLREISGKLKSLRAGDMALASDMNMIGVALELLKDDLLDRGLVCAHCDTINVARSGSCVKCGAPLGRSLPK